MILIIFIIVVVVGLVIFLRVKNNDTSQKRLRRFQKQHLKNLHKNLGNIVLHEVSNEERVNTKSSYIIDEDGTIIRSDKDLHQTIKYAPLSNESPMTHISVEEAVSKESILRKRLLSGEQLDFADCNYILDLSDNVEVWKAICRNHIQESVYPPINIIENYNSDRSLKFYDMVYRIINLCVSGYNGGKNVALPAEFVKNTILFSTNVDALYVIADFQEKDMHDSNYDNKLNVELFNEIKKLAYNRYIYLTTRRK